MKKNALTLTAILLFTATGAAQPSNVADAFSRLDHTVTALQEELTPQDSYFLGRAAAAMILERWRPYNENPALTAYLNMICMALVLNSQTPNLFNGYHLTILDSAVPNAFSTSGGHVFITRGMVSLASSEDMLAAVIAHEIAHIQLAHGIQSVNYARLVRSLQEDGARAAAIAGREAASLENRRIEFQAIAAGMINTLLENGYSQTQELEADSLALDLLASAGYAPISLVDILRLLERNQPLLNTGFAATHPNIALRIANVERKARSYQLTDTRSIRRSRYESILRNSN